ncbi:chromosome partitioning protein ParA [Vibrio plantisponsor]|uniref:chromosome partitioning protein ParA n=1 Tax=Vibrio plantisponsor TaxID=664643 RepID=UPI00370A0727
MKKVGLSLLALAISSALVGCGGSDSDSKSTEPTETTSYSVPSSGSFVDATVEGLYYVSGTKSGYTSSTGVYNVDTDEAVVTFYLGGENGFEIGTISARSVSTPFEAAGTYERSVNLARLLLTIDNTSDESYIVIPTTLQGVTDGSALSTALQKISLDDEEFEDSIADLLTELSISSIVSADDAIEHMDGSLSDLTRGEDIALTDWAKGSDGVFVSRSAIQRIKNSSSDSFDFAIHGDNTQGSTVFNNTSGMLTQTYVLGSDSFVTKSGSNDGFFSGSRAEAYLECVIDGGSYSKSSGCDTTSTTDMSLSGPYQYVLNNPDATLTNDESYDWDEVAEMGGAYECMSNSSCSESTLTKYQVVEDRDDSDDSDGSEMRDEVLSGSYDPITGVYTQVRSKEYTVTSEATVGRVEESIEFIYQVDAVGEDKYVDFTGTWKAIQTAPGCDEVGEETWVFDSEGVTVTGHELSVDTSTSPYTCSVTTRSTAETTKYADLAKKDYWWFTTNSAGDSKATLDQLNTTIRWNDRDDTDTSDSFKINRFSYIPAGSDWDLGVLVRDTLNDNGVKTATTIMRKISQ